ncbi:hypothetical protein [Cytobacillus pseudoceanisediminis]|uniref:hypothetical protein n=1 Tax=Cytobacillus pseudoceanisediminis TaxID=3051614 RepID=UPI003CF56004
MIRFISAIFTAEDDPGFGEVKSEVILLAADLVLERFENEANIFLLDEPVAETQATVRIDRSTCKRFQADFLAEDNKRLTELGFNWLIGASLIEVLREFAKK